MIHLVTSDRYGEFVDELEGMHRLCYRVFKELLGWDVEVAGDMEIDEFDALHPTWLLLRGFEGRLLGCVARVFRVFGTDIQQMHIDDEMRLVLDDVIEPRHVIGDFGIYAGFCHVAFIKAGSRSCRPVCRTIPYSFRRFWRG